MSMSSQQDFEPHIISTCESHTNGDGRECPYCVDSEYYSQNTLNGAVTVTSGSGIN